MDLETEVKIAALEAKVFMYEEIIKKSSFAPMVQIASFRNKDTFTRMQVCNLQSKVHEIIGSGKVMDLFHAFLK